MSELRRRRVNKMGAEDESEGDPEIEPKSTDDKNENPAASKTEPPSGAIDPESFWLTRIVFLRYLGFIYFVAFLISYNQNKELLGSHGLTPASNFLLNGKKTVLDLALSSIHIMRTESFLLRLIKCVPDISVGQRSEDTWSRIIHVPSLLWLAHPHYTDLDRYWQINITSFDQPMILTLFGSIQPPGRAGSHRVPPLPPGHGHWHGQHAGHGCPLGALLQSGKCHFRLV